MLQIALVLGWLALGAGDASPPQRAAQEPTTHDAADCETYLRDVSSLADWICLGEADVLAPRPHDRWELRSVWIVASGDADPQKRKLYIDQQTHEAIYLQSYDERGRLSSAVWLKAW